MLNGSRAWGSPPCSLPQNGRTAMSWATKAAVKQQLRSPSQRIALLDDIRTRLASAETLAAMRAAYTADQASALERERRAKEEAYAEMAEMRLQMAALQAMAQRAVAQAQPQQRSGARGQEQPEDGSEDGAGHGPGLLVEQTVDASIVSGGYGA